MFAIFESGGKQYKVVVGNYLKLPKQNLKKGETIKFNKVLSVKNCNNELIVGSPYVVNASVQGEVVDQIRDKKIVIFKKKRRKNYRRKIGHRQDLTLIKIKEINLASNSKSKIDTEVKKKISENKKVEDVNGS